MVGHLQIVERFGVGIHAEVLVVVAAKTVTDTVRMVEHRGDAIEPVAVELKLVQPVVAVAQQKAQGFPLRVVEQTAVPQTVHAATARMEEARIGTVEHIQTILHILAGMRMDQIEQNVDSVLVTRVNETFQCIWCTVSGGEKKIKD